MLEVSVERKEIEDTRDIVDGLMLSLKQTAHLCDLTCFEKVSYTLKKLYCIIDHRSFGDKERFKNPRIRA